MSSRYATEHPGLHTTHLPLVLDSGMKVEVLGGPVGAVQYGPDSSRSYFADLAWARFTGVPLAEVPIEQAKAAYVRGDIEIDELEQRVAEALA